MTSQQASNNTWRKGYFGVFSLAKIGCLGLLAGLSYSFPSLLFCYTRQKQGWSANKKCVGTHPKKLAILKQLQTNLKPKHGKGVGFRSHAFPPHYTPGHKSDEHSTAISTEAKTLEVTEKHDKHVLQLTASCSLFF